MLLLAFLSHASEADGSGAMSGYRLTAGVTLHSIDFSVSTKDSGTLGTLSEDFSYAPFIFLGSPYRYFGDSNWGGYMEYGFSGFRLNQQLVNDELVDLGTSVTGWHVFVTPNFFYNFGDKHAYVNQGYSLKIGVGVGAGYVNASGDVILTETTQQRHEFDVSGLGLGISIVADLRWRDLMLRASSGGAETVKSGLGYETFDFSFDIGYVYEF